MPTTEGVKCLACHGDNGTSGMSCRQQKVWIVWRVMAASKRPVCHVDNGTSGMSCRQRNVQYAMATAERPVCRADNGTSGVSCR